MRQPLNATRRADLALIGLFFLLPLILFWQQTVGGKTLLPTENLYQYEPFATYREVVKAPEIPHNALLSDLILQNYQWKTFIREQLAQGEIPLWNPHTFSGTPFLAAGQQSTLYPLSILYYILPLPAAYGWFTVVNLWLAGVFAYTFARGLGVSRFGAAISGVTYQLCGMFIASAVHPMIIGSVVWLPLLLLMIEFTLRRQPLFGRPTTAPWITIGAVALACTVLAGHAELLIYSLLISGYYTAMRLVIGAWQQHSRLGPSIAIRWLAQRAAAVIALVVLGMGLGAVQFIPLFELVQMNWRTERTDLSQVLSYAHAPRDIVQFAVPNFYGSPAHHQYFDVFTFQPTDIAFTNPNGEYRTQTDWGMKNYVEGALYLGILPLMLSITAVVEGIVRRLQRDEPALENTELEDQPPYRLIFGLLALLSLTFMFGFRPTYSVLYLLPGINQLNTPFRWIYGVTVSVVILAGFGTDVVMTRRMLARRLGIISGVVGILTLVGLLVSRLLYSQLEPLIQRVFEGMENAQNAFPSTAAFYSYSFINVLIFGVITLLSGLALWWLGREQDQRPRYGAETCAIALIAIDLLIASWGFNPASDPALLDFTPPAVEWLQNNADPHDRIMALIENGQRDILTANINFGYGLNDVVGYDSIILQDYVAYMRQIANQSGSLLHNRIAPLYTSNDVDTILNSPRFQRLGVRYLVAHKTVQLDASAAGATLVHEDEAVNIWEVESYPFIYAPETPKDIDLSVDEPLSLQDIEAELISDSGRELIYNIELAEPNWIVVSQTYAPGWKVFIRPISAEESEERELTVEQVQEIFQGVFIPQAGAWTLRLIYSPTSFQVGAFTSILSAGLLLLLLGFWIWQRFIARETDETGSAARLARNTVAPILLNLFNRVIDLVFASILFRILGPTNAGDYYYAIAVFGWFDIITNFGLDVYLMREAGRDRDRARQFFNQTSLLRYGLIVICIPLLIGFLLIRQSASETLDPAVLWTIALFYVGLIPGGLSKGLTSLFYAFERAEYPAAVTTITTICRVTFGLIVLLVGYGAVGLAAVSIVTNVITLGVLYSAARRFLQVGRSSNDTTAAVEHQPIGPIVRQSLPLMLNHLLATIFFQIDIIILEWFWGTQQVGLYRTAYSWLLAINVIPAFFTQALMPIMSRQWKDNPAALIRSYTLGIKLLTSIAFPMAVAFTFLAEVLTRILGGSAYLPDGAIALQIMIWSIPIGWMNSLTQYALIAVELQRRITIAFVIAVGFNIVSNLILIPTYGYRAAALTTIASEAALFIPFAILMQHAFTQRGLGSIGWLRLLWRQATAAVVMLVTVGVLWGLQPLLALSAGSVVYIVVLVYLKPLVAAEIEFLAAHLPTRTHRWLFLLNRPSAQVS
jgi:O-antigen/teichoic acid export membrane protein